MKKKNKSKTNIKKGAGMFVALTMFLSLLGNKNVACAVSNELKTGGVTVKITLTDGRSSGITQTKLLVTNGPTIGLKTEALIYYRFGKGSYYSTSGVKTASSVQLSASIEKKLAGAEIDYCSGYFRASYLDSAASDTLSIGKLKNPVTEYKKL